jgi:zinc transporter ZupT
MSDCPNPAVCDATLDIRSGEKVAVAFALSIGAGLASAIGAAAPFIPGVRKERKEILAVGLGLSAGVMIYVSFIDVLPEAAVYHCCSVGRRLAELVSVAIFFGSMILIAAFQFLAHSPAVHRFGELARRVLCPCLAPPVDVEDVALETVLAPPPVLPQPPGHGHGHSHLSPPLEDSSSAGSEGSSGHHDATAAEAEVGLEMTVVDNPLTAVVGAALSPPTGDEPVAGPRQEQEPAATRLQVRSPPSTSDAAIMVACGSPAANVIRDASKKTGATSSASTSAAVITRGGSSSNADDTAITSFGGNLIDSGRRRSRRRTATEGGEGGHEADEDEQLDEEETEAARNEKLRRMGLLTALAVAIHNLPEGAVTFAGTFPASCCRHVQLRLNLH